MIPSSKSVNSMTAPLEFFAPTLFSERKTRREKYFFLWPPLCRIGWKQKQDFTRSLRILPSTCFDAPRKFLITIKCNLTNYTVVSAPTEILNLDKTLPKFRFPVSNKLECLADMEFGLIHLFQINCSELTLAWGFFMNGESGRSLR